MFPPHTHIHLVTRNCNLTQVKKKILLFSFFPPLSLIEGNIKFLKSDRKDSIWPRWKIVSPLPSNPSTQPFIIIIIIICFLTRTPPPGKQNSNSIDYPDRRPDEEGAATRRSPSITKDAAEPMEKKLEKDRNE